MNSLGFAHVVVSFAATYLLHSTVLITACWIVIHGLRVTSHYLIERAWKLAAMLGMVTALLQTGTGIAGLPTVSTILQFARVETSNESALAGLSQKSADETHATITRPPSVASVIGHESDSIENNVGHDSAIAQHVDQAKTRMTAEALFDRTALSATSDKPERAFRIDQTVESDLEADSAPIVSQSSGPWEVPTISSLHFTRR